MHPLEDFVDHMDYFVEQKKSEDRLRRALTDLEECAKDWDSYGFVNMAKILKEIEVTRKALDNR